MYESTSEEDDDGADDEGDNKSGLLDLEDLGPMMNTMKQAKVNRAVIKDHNQVFSRMSVQGSCGCPLFRENLLFYFSHVTL